MNTCKVLIIISIIICICGGNCLHADSIWAKRDKNQPNLYADDVAKQIGDVLTIKITEASKVDNKAKSDFKKDTARSIDFNGQLGNFADLGEFGTNASSGNSLSGKADLKDERSFEDRITVIVIDVMPNGNLVVMGTRSRDIAGDKQTIEISGIIRQRDISYDNTIKSEQVADFKIVSKNTGNSEPYNRPGWLGRFFDIIWPF
jgi:flagellar L-ring protein FlgH